MADGWMKRAGRAVAGFFGGESEEQADVPAKAPQVVGTAPELSAADLNTWKNRLRRAKAEAEDSWNLADEMRSEYLGPHDPRFEAKSGGRKGRPVNLVASFIHTSFPRLFPANPWPMADANREGDEYADGAKRLEARLRQVMDATENYRQLRRVVFDAFFLAGFALTAWRPNTSQAYLRGKAKTEPGQVPAKMPADAQAGVPGSADEADTVVYRHIPYRDMRLDADSTSFDDCEWTGYEVDRQLHDIQAADVKHGGMYKNTEDVRPSEDTESRSGRSQADYRTKVTTIYHRGRRRGEVGVLVLAGPGYTEIRHDYVDFGIRGFPIRMLGFRDVARLWPANPVQFWLDLHDAFNEFVAEAAERARQAKAITVVPNKETQDQVVNAAGGAVIISADSNLVKQLQVGGTTPDTWNAMAAFERLTDKISGITDFRRGMSEKGGKSSATEISIMAQFSEGQLADLQGGTNRFLREVAQDAAGMLLKFQWQDVEVKVDTGPGQCHFGTFSNRTVVPELSAYDIDIDVADHERQNPLVRQKRSQDTLELLMRPEVAQGLAAEGRQIRLSAAIEDVLDSTGVRDVDRYLVTLPSPEDQMAQQGQLAESETQQMIQTGQALPVNPDSDVHNLHIRVHMGMGGEHPAVIEHVSEHYAYLEAASMRPPQAGPAATGQGAQGGGGLQGAVVPQGDAQVAAEAAAVR